MSPGNNDNQFPGPWSESQPEWLRKHGRTVVVVLDDQIQNTASLTDEVALRTQVCEPLNVEFAFCPDCAAGAPLSGSERWFPAAEQLVRKHQDRIAALFLDIMFDGEWDPLEGSGLRFLSRIQAVIPDLPVLIMTQARDERQLHRKLAQSGLHLDFLQKDSDDRVAAIRRFLVEHGWLSDPAFSAFSVPMRAALSGLRNFALQLPRLETGLPSPILITAASGEGKTRTARIAARWLQDVRSDMRGGNIEFLDCNVLERGQGARIALFGRGLRGEAGETTDSSGLAVRGKTQIATGGTLIVDELGNSDLAFQEMLLSFVESGRAEPEFRTNRMTQDALGPLDVLCIFTAQPGHLTGRISEDLVRRCSRGTTLRIPPLGKRSSDILPIFYGVLRSQIASRDADSQPGDIDDVILPEAQKWLISTVPEYNLSASTLADLVGQPQIRVIGVPYLEHRLRHILGQPSQSRATDTSNAAVADSDPDSASAGEDVVDLVARLADSPLLSFPRDARELRGQLAQVQSAAANLLLSYLEGALELGRGVQDGVNVTGTYKFVTGEDDIDGNTARTRLKDILLVSKDRTLEALRQSDDLLKLAITIAKGKRSQEIRRELLDVLEQDSLQAERLRRFGWH